MKGEENLDMREVGKIRVCMNVAYIMRSITSNRNFIECHKI